MLPSRDLGGNDPDLASWVFSSDVCKHCEKAGCLEACPTGAIVRTEFGGVFVQPDVCNGCSYCVVACPFGVVQRNPEDGRAFKCTFCYDRQKVGLHPACATACPTESIKFGPIEADEAGRAGARARSCRPAAWTMPASTIRRTPASEAFTRCSWCAAIRGSTICRRILRCPTIYNKAGWTSSAVAAGLLLVGSLFAFLGSAKR